MRDIVLPGVLPRITHSGEFGVPRTAAAGMPFEGNMDEREARLRKELETYELILGRLRSEGDGALNDLARSIERRIAETKAGLAADTVRAPSRRA